MHIRGRDWFGVVNKQALEERLRVYDSQSTPLQGWRGFGQSGWAKRVQTG